MKIIASYNIKGGVGKTAAAVNLSYLAAQDGARTLIWDLDPQGAASFYFRISVAHKKAGKQLIDQKTPMDDMIKGTDFDNLDLIASNISYRHMDLYLDALKKPLNHIKKLLTPLQDEYDYVFLDCPPSISLVSESVFKASDMLLVPTIPTTLSIRTLEQLANFLKKQKIDTHIIVPFFSMVDRRKNLHRNIIANPSIETINILKAAIPYASEVEQMGIHRTPIFSYAKQSQVAGAYKKLWREIKEILE